MEKFDIIFNKINQVIACFLVAIFSILVLDVLFQVFSRYILNTSYSWTEELARFLLIWLSILGATYLNAKREHLSMDFLYKKFSKSAQRRISIIIEMFIFLFALIIMVIGGFNLVYTTLHLEQLSGTLRVPLGYVYAVLPFSGCLISCFSIYHIIKIYKKQITY